MELNYCMLRKSGMKLMCTDNTQNKLSTYLEYVEFVPGFGKNIAFVDITQMKCDVY
jgi:hypothetical protein